MASRAWFGPSYECLGFISVPCLILHLGVQAIGVHVQRCQGTSIQGLPDGFSCAHMHTEPGLEASSFPPTSPAFLSGLSRAFILKERGLPRPQRSSRCPEERLGARKGSGRTSRGCAAQGGFAPPRLHLARGGRGEIQVPMAIINIVINISEWFYSKLSLHRTLIRRHLSLSPPLQLFS